MSSARPVWMDRCWCLTRETSRSLRKSLRDEARCSFVFCCSVMFVSMIWISISPCGRCEDMNGCIDVWLWIMGRVESVSLSCNPSRYEAAPQRSKVTLDKQSEVVTCSRTMINYVISEFGIIKNTLMRFLLFTPGLLNSFQVELQIGHNVKLHWTFFICLTAVSSVVNEVLNNVALIINISVKQTHFLHQRPLDHI